MLYLDSANKLGYIRFYPSASNPGSLSYLSVIFSVSSDLEKWNALVKKYSDIIEEKRGF